jgi:hypothetical protein
MANSTKGFHFQDSEGILSDIIDVKVMDTQFAPFGFDPDLISFDKDNIYVDLDGSMCHLIAMASMPLAWKILRVLCFQGIKKRI